MRIAYSLALGAILLGGCRGLTDVPDPSTIVDPGVVQTQEGAVGQYRLALSKFGQVFAGSSPNFPTPSFVLADGAAGDQIMTKSNDQAQLYQLRFVEPALWQPLGYTDVTQPYADMHSARLNIGEAIGSLQRYAPTAPTSYIAELYALRGYLYVMFSELYCSGIPFSKAIYGGDIVLLPGETTTEMLNDAVAQFDTALTFVGDSTRIKQLAYLGKARALLDLGKFPEAAAAASSGNVPTSFAYTFGYSTTGGFTNVFASSTSPGAFFPALYVPDRAGTNGLPYISAPDARVATISIASFPPTIVPAKYSSPSSSVTMGNGIEARLIEAEAALQAHDTIGWAQRLNDLRATAISPALPNLTADSTTTASQTLRENVMFHERAYWLFVTGHRLGDLRRLIRQYNRPAETVLTVGTITSGVNTYARSIKPNFEPPKSEMAGNPKYTGCINRDA